MKLRLRLDTLRLRLTRTDIAAFRDGGRLEASTSFPGGARLFYVLERGAGFDASFEGGSIVVRLPGALADAWCDTDRVGLAGTVTLADGGVLELLIEKDFACLTENRPEDRDAFPNPHESC